MMNHKIGTSPSSTDAVLNTSFAHKPASLLALAAAAALASSSLPTKAALYQDGYSDSAAQALAEQYGPSLGRIFFSLDSTPYTASGVFLDDNWVLTAAHLISNPNGTGDASIIGISQGATPNSLTPVVSYYVYPGYNGTGNAPDLALLYLGPNGVNAPTLAFGSAAPGEVVTSAGFGFYGSPSTGYQNPEGNARGWYAPVFPSPSGGYSPTYYASTGFFPGLGSLNGRGLGGDSGSPVFNSSGELVGINIAAEGGLRPIGSTTYLKLNQSDVFGWMNHTFQSVPEPSALALAGLGAATLLASSRRKKG
jgi:hypothetical protein